MHVHLYAQCLDDERMLPYFFRNYDGLVDRYVIFDDGSTDRSLSILHDHPRVEVRSFDRSVAESFVLSEQALSNECWKESRGQADWVIVTDIDEHLHHRHFREYLSSMLAQGVTLIPALGFQMISESIPAPEDNLSETITRGAPWEKMMKASIFDPDGIAEIAFTHGRHKAEPTGIVRVPDTDEMLLLHYKYVSLEQTHARHQQLNRGLRSVDVQNGWGHKYSWSLDQLRADWEAIAAASVDVASMRDSISDGYPFDRWWEKYRMGTSP